MKSSAVEQDKWASRENDRDKEEIGSIRISIAIVLPTGNSDTAAAIFATAAAVADDDDPHHTEHRKTTPHP